MTRRALNEEISVAATLIPNVRTATVAGVSVDLAGFGEAVFIAHIGTITDGTFAFDPEHSDNGTDWENCAAGDLSGAFTNATSAADDRVQEVGYVGNRRYVRCGLTASGSPATGGAIGISVLRAAPRLAPVT